MQHEALDLLRVRICCARRRRARRSRASESRCSWRRALLRPRLGRALLRPRLGRRRQVRRLPRVARRARGRVVAHGGRRLDAAVRARARPSGYLGCATQSSTASGSAASCPCALRTTCSLPPWSWSCAAATSRTHVGSLVAVAVGYRPADALLAEARRRAEAVGLRGCEVEVDGVTLPTLAVRVDARGVAPEADAGAEACPDPFAGLVRADEVDDGFAGGCFACDVELRPTRWPAPRTRRPSPPTSSAPRRELRRTHRYADLGHSHFYFVVGY